MKRNLSLSIVSIFLFSIVAWTQPIKPLLIGNESEWSLNNHAFCFTTAQNLTPNQAFALVSREQLTPVTKSHINLGLQPNYVWIYFRLKNKEISKTILFLFDRIDIHHVQCFRNRSGHIDTLALTGDALPFWNRPIQINYFAIPIPLIADEESDILILLEKRNEFISGNLSLHSTASFLQRVRFDSAVVAFFLGIASFIFLFNFLLWLSLRDTAHLLFMAHIIAIILYVLSSLGYGFEFLWPRWIYSNSLIMTLLAGLWASTNLFLIKRFLGLTSSTSRYSKTTSWLGWYILAISIGGCSIALIQPQKVPTFVLQLGICLLILWIIANTILLISVFIEQIRKQNKVAYIYAIALGFTLTGTVIYILTILNIVNAGHYTINWLLPGFLLEEITLAFGLTLRYNAFQKQNFILKLSLAETQNEANARIIQTQETERQRLAADLHDDLGGTLATIRRRLSDIRQRLRDPVAAGEMDALEPLIQKSGQDLRRIAHNLMPPEFERIGLRSALQQFVESQPANPTRFSFLVAGTEQKLPLDTELNIYRIVSELVQNIHKHAQAQRAAVQLLYYDDQLSITVEDDGLGSRAVKIGDEKEGIGLKNSSLRAEYIGAKLWREASESGTLIVLDVPYPTTPDANPRTNPNSAD